MTRRDDDREGLLNFKDDLGNPPLLIVSDLDRIEIRTNFTSLSPVAQLAD